MIWETEMIQGKSKIIWSSPSTKFMLNWPLWFFRQKVCTKKDWVLNIWISLNIKFYFEQSILKLWTKFAKKAYFCSKTEQVNTIIKIYIFHLKLAILFIFWPILPKKGISGLKQKKWTSSFNSVYLH